MEKNKVITYIVIILFLIFFLLIIIINLLSKIKKTSQEKKSSSFNNTSSANFNWVKKTIYQPKTTIHNQKEIVLPSLFVAGDGYGENQENASRIKKDEFLKKLPLASSDFLIIYNQQTGKFEVYFKNPNEKSKEDLINWLKLNGFSEEEINSFFEIKNETLDSYLFQNQTSQQPVFTYSSGMNPNLSLLTDFLKIFFNLGSLHFNGVNIDFDNNLNPPPTNNINYGTPQGYNPNARGCYTPKRFIEVYADGLTPDGPPNCYQNVKAKVESYLVPINFLGATIRVHKKTSSYFQSVDQELSSYKIEGRKYKFRQGEYNFSFLGTYAFRCNVNASTTTNVWDVCDPGCVLSPHSFGFAIDINPQTNPNHSDKFDMPPEVVSAFRRYGFRWGGEWKDAMHFEYLGELCQN